MDHADDLRSCLQDSSATVEDIGEYTMVKSYPLRTRIDITVELAMAFKFSNFPHDVPSGFHIALTLGDYEMCLSEEAEHRNLKVCQFSDLQRLCPELLWYYLSRPYTNNYSNPNPNWGSLLIEDKNMTTYFTHVQHVLRFFFQ